MMVTCPHRSGTCPGRDAKRSCTARSSNRPPAGPRAASPVTSSWSAHDRPQVGTRRRRRCRSHADGGAFVVIASDGGAPRHPDWYRKVAGEHRHVDVVVGETLIAASAETVTGPDRDRLWRAAVLVSGLPRLPGPNRTRGPGGETRTESTVTGCVNPEGTSRLSTGSVLLCQCGEVFEEDRVEVSGEVSLDATHDFSVGAGLNEYRQAA